jgi:hypothetical protein
LSLVVKKTRAIIDPANFKFKILLYGLPGIGKTEWLSTAPDIGIAACETGIGKGLLTIAQKDLEYVEPSNLAELESFCNASVFKDKQSIGLDSMSWMSKSFIREAALAIPRKQGDAQKRAQGVPEIDDYQVMAEISRRLLAKLLERNQHLIVTATEKSIDTADGGTMYVPDLPGALALTCTAMFDFVFRMRTRQKFADRTKPESRYVERYLVTQPDGLSTLAKCRPNNIEKALLPSEVVFDRRTGEGSFPWCLAKILEEYGKLPPQ